MNPDFNKYSDGLMPAIVQDAMSGRVLMLGYMNREAFEITERTRRVTFFSRSKNRLWTKGESSGHFLELVSVVSDCDEDALLVKANPAGPVCHTGKDTCFGEDNSSFSLSSLEEIIRKRIQSGDGKSYTASLVSKGVNAVAQKVGEEAVELVIAAKDEDRQRLLDEAADLLFHSLVLLQLKGASLEQVVSVLADRHHAKR